MNLSDLTARRKVKKKIDDSVSSTPSSVSTINDPPIQAVIEETKINTIIADTIEQAQEIIDLTHAVIDDIVKTSNSDPVFKEYAELAKQSYIDPAINLQQSNTSIIPALKAAERDVYRRVIDPRAPFITDLYQIASEAGLTKYTFQQVWSRLAEETSLYSKFEGDRLFRLSLQQDRLLLDNKKAYVNQVATNKASKLGSKFISSILRKSLNKIDVQETKAKIESINKVIRFLKGMRAMLNIELINQTTNWETFRAILKDSLGDLTKSVALKLIRAQSHAAASALENELLEFASGIESLTGFELEDNSEFSEFSNQINSSLFSQLSAVEDFHVSSLKESIDTEITRSHMLSNSQKVLKTKQYVDAVDSIILQMEVLKSSIANLNVVIEQQFEGMARSVQEQTGLFINGVATRPSQPILELLDLKGTIDNEENI